ncbi:MAG TPA: ABC transporter permease [Puia sp.]|jgi:ABC-type antimicrobial peptide transport system permease subunit
MLKAYFKTAWRNILRNKVYSILNIAGLAAGMAVALLIGLWVCDQSSFDKFLPGYQQAYQVRFRYSDNGVIRTQPMMCIPLATALKTDIPEIAHTTMSFGWGDNDFTVGTRHVTINNMIAGEEFLEIFQFPIVKGNAKDALKDVYSIVLTESAAKALFGTSDVLNRQVRGPNGDNLRVTAVIKDLPKNSTMQFKSITSFSAFASGGWVKAAVNNWNHCFFTMYASLKPGVTYAQVEPKVRMLMQKYAPAAYKTFQQQVVMQPMADWHLYTEFKNGYPSGGLIDYIRLFSIIGVLVLLIACINFMNLSTARSEKRAREVGVRKVMGSGRGGLIMQFLIESVTITFLSFGLSLLLVQLVLPSFNALVKTQIAIPYSSLVFWVLMISYVLVTGLLAGSRPAFYLSSFQPVKVLRGAMRVGRSATLPRKILVVLQFTCSIGLIISTVIIYQQIEYARNRPTGYDPNRLLTTYRWSHYPALKQEALASGWISGMTRSLSQATEVDSHNVIDDWPGREPNEALNLAMNALADSDYFKTMGTPLVAGRNFTGNAAVDSTDVIVNESAVRRMRLKQPLNQIITWHLSNAPNRLRIIGVAKDALTSNPFGEAEPTIFVFQPDWAYSLTFRLAPTVNTRAALAGLQPIFQKYSPGYSFDYNFVDETYATKFTLELLIGKLAAIFAILAIFISCLGLFGLSAYMAEQRGREIGIRKVLGATVSQVLVLLSGDFILLVGLSCIIASPLAWYFSHRWLQGYYYRISIGPGVFVFSALVAMVITTGTIAFQAVRAAMMNPVHSLR